MRKRKKYYGFTKLEWLAIIIFLFATVISPYLFTQFSSGISFIGSGEIGDTIGGITAPFINLLAAFLVWKSFREQQIANEMLSKESSYNYINSLFQSVKGYSTTIGGIINSDLFSYWVTPEALIEEANFGNPATYDENIIEKHVKEDLSKILLEFIYLTNFLIELDNSSVAKIVKNNFALVLLSPLSNFGQELKEKTEEIKDLNFKDKEIFITLDQVSRKYLLAQNLIDKIIKG